VCGRESLKEELLDSNEVAGGVTFKIKNDPRRTRIGTLMRTWSIDELPQLWNVFKGDMSLVGPRPPLPAEVQQYTLAQRRRLDAIPGLTCIWQVSGRSEIPFARQVELDTEYIDSQSVSLDVKLLFRTYRPCCNAGELTESHYANDIVTGGLALSVRTSRGSRSPRPAAVVVYDKLTYAAIL